MAAEKFCACDAYAQVGRHSDFCPLADDFDAPSNAVTVTDQTRDMLVLHLSREDWTFIRTILVTRHLEAFQGSLRRARTADAIRGTDANRERFRVELEREASEINRILEFLDVQASI